MSFSVRETAGNSGYSTSMWTAAHVAAMAKAALPAAPVIDAAAATPLFPEYDLWDLWPLQNADGSVTNVCGGSLWMVLSAPRRPDPNGRHDIARTRMLFRAGEKWHDCGLLFPDDLNPGSREWSGSARFDPSSSMITAYFTAAGRRDEVSLSFEQRLFQTAGMLDLSGSLPRITDWSRPTELAVNDGTHYFDLDQGPGVPGNIRGFRDPYWFCDPKDERAYILFTGSTPDGVPDCNGVIGIAAARSGKGETGFELMPAIISADGVANEMERPHMLFCNGLYYLFWSSHQNVFAANGPKALSGLYGMVGPSVTGPFEPLNGTGLVIANPPAEPSQAYCWQVLDNLDVVSFVDHWGLNGRDPMSDATLNRGQFGGTVAPVLKIAIDGPTTRLLGLA